MFKLIKRFWPYLFILTLTAIFFRPLLHKLVPIPFDGLAGAYFPWLDDKWGYAVGVPVKNISVTDVFSQLYPWRLLSLDFLKSGQLPLWNPYSFSGVPHLANWQSAPFYPLNLLMFLFGNLWGYTAIIVSQILLGLTFFYLYLKQLKLSSTNSLIGAVIFAFSGFMTTYLEYATAGQIFLWLPLLLLALEKYFSTHKPLYLLSIPILLFFVFTGGFFQPAFYVSLLAFTYFLAKVFTTSKHKLSDLILGFSAFALGVGLSALQFLPVLELLSLSIRNLDHNITQYQYGLLPLKHLLTLIAPDFYGNPSTNNYWGVFQYQEAAGYFGLISFGVIISSLFHQPKSFHLRFFLFFFFSSLLLAFNNPLSRLVYQLKIPFISTGYASRWYLVTGVSTAVIVPFSLQQFKTSWRYRYAAFISFLLVFIALIYIFITKRIFPQSLILAQDPVFSELNIAFRNLLLPTMLAFAFFISTLIFKNKKLLSLIFLLLITFDLFRFSTKFTPFAPVRLSSTDMPVFNYLKQNAGYYRIEKESGPLLPSNTWLYPRLYSPSGYDPLLPLKYASFYRVYNAPPPDHQITKTDLTDGSFTRYLELTNYNSPILDLAGVKYLLALKKSEGRILPEGTELHHLIDTDRFQKVFESGSTVVLENKNVLPRVKLYDSVQIESDDYQAMADLANNFDFRHQIILNQSPTSDQLQLTDSDQAEIISYQADSVTISSSTSHSTILFLSDTNYPGWQVTIDSQPATLLTAFGIYRAVQLPPGQHQVEFSYQPASFRFGLYLSLTSLAILLTSALYFLSKNHEKTKH